MRILHKADNASRIYSDEIRDTIDLSKPKPKWYQPAMLDWLVKYTRSGAPDTDEAWKLIGSFSDQKFYSSASGALTMAGEDSIVQNLVIDPWHDEVCNS